MKRYINTIAIDNNSPELHNKLKELGYKPLSWTTVTGKGNLRTVLTNSFPYVKEGYRLSFWNDGSSSDKFRNSRSVIFCDTVDEFIEKSIYLSSNDNIIIEEN